MSRTTIGVVSAIGSAALAAGALIGTTAAAAPSPTDAGQAAARPAAAGTGNLTQVRRGGTIITSFELERAAGVVRAGCLPNARAKVQVVSGHGNERMKVWVSGLPAETEFDFFVLQVPDAPFGLSWYQGDIETNRYGRGSATFIGRFNEETFSVAVGPAPAPVTHDGDADTNPVTRPVHQYHLGFWFNDPADAAKAGCGDLVTPFNGEHNAGTQAMSSRGFPANAGPLGRIGA